jgi:hypothetical protein
VDAELQRIAGKFQIFMVEVTASSSSDCSFTKIYVLYAFYRHSRQNMAILTCHNYTRMFRWETGLNIIVIRCVSGTIVVAVTKIKRR